MSRASRTISNTRWASSAQHPSTLRDAATGWILLDFGSVLVHLFQKDQREYYNLERLWNDAQQLDISDLLTD